MKQRNNLITISKEESSTILGGYSRSADALAERIGAGVGRFSKRFCRFILKMMKSKDFVSYR